MSTYNSIIQRSCRNCGKAFVGHHVNCSEACEKARRAAGYRKALKRHNGKIPSRRYTGPGPRPTMKQQIMGDIRNRGS